MTLFSVAYIMINFSKAYRKERNKLYAYGQPLKESNEKRIALCQIDE